MVIAFLSLVPPLFLLPLFRPPPGLRLPPAPAPPAP